MALELWLQGVGLCAPGLEDWTRGRMVLAGEGPYRPAALPPLRVALASRNDSRRLSPSARLALRVALEAAEDRTAGGRRELAAVFACSGGDTGALDRLCEALTLPDRPLSPIAFTNSVHNAPAGYWAVATGVQAPTVSLSAYDASFAAGLLEAATIALVEGRGRAETGLDTAALEHLRTGNPAARALPLLAAVAAAGGRVVLPYLSGSQLLVEVSPC